MKDGIGEGFTREDHQDVANQLFSCYAKVGDARALASVIGEDELSPLDKRYLVFGKAFEAEFVGQSETENRSITETLDKGWELLGLLPKDELDRIDTKILNKKVKRLAMKSALSAKAAAGEIIVIDSIKMDAIKTKDFRAFLSAVKADGKSLVVTPAKDETVIKSARNIPGVETTMANLMNVYDILKAKYLVLDKEALAVIEEVFA